MIIKVRAINGRLIIFLLIILLGLVLRGYNITKSSTMGYDQSRDFLIVKKLIDNRTVTLLGPETEIGTKKIYFGPLYYYLLGAQLVVFKGDPQLVYYSCVALGWASLLLFILFKKNLQALFFLSTFPLLVISSRFPWNPNLIPLFAILSYGLFIRKKYLFAGIFFGCMIQLHYTSLLGMLFFPAYLILRKEKISARSASSFVVGLIVALSPILIFDIRHDFLNIKSILSINFADLRSRTLGWYYFYWLAPSLAFLLSKHRRFLSFLSVFMLYFTISYLLNIKQNDVLQVQNVKEISKKISLKEKKSKVNFNVASIADADSRATAYRYFLYLDAANPLGVGEYSVSDHLYVISPRNNPREILDSKLYEINSFHPKYISSSDRISDTYLFRVEYK